MLSAVVALAPALQADPVKRMTNHLVGRKDYAFDFSYESNLYGKGKGRFAWSLPNGQQFDLQTASGRFSMSQRRDGTFFVDHTAKTYWEHRAFPALAPPSGDIEDLGPAYPQIIVSIAKGTKVAWKVEPRQAYNGVQVDKLTASFPIQDSQVPVAVYVSQTGEILALTATAKIEGATSILKASLSGHDTSPQNLAGTNFELPNGYMPGQVPSSYRPVRSGYKAPFGQWSDARSGKTVNAAGEFRGKKVAVLFTDKDCKISTRAEGVWKEAAAVIKSQGGTLIEVSLDASKPTLEAKDQSRRVFYDPAGKIEAEWQPPVTPYLFFVREDGYVTRAWAGYGQDQKGRFLKFCKAGFQPGVK